jgi:hypothetical protein
VKQAIYKYVIENIGQPVEIEVGPHFQPLMAQIQNGSIVVWGLVTIEGGIEEGGKEAKPSKRRFYVVGTGWDLPFDPLLWSYIGTGAITQLGSSFVWHVWIEKTPAQLRAFYGVGP